MSDASLPYKMSFAVGGLYLNECIQVARLHSPSTSWETTLQKALQEGIASLPKATSRRRMLRELVNRISTFDNDELRYLVDDADRQDQQAMLWLSTCRAYRFVREFAVEVIHERYLSFQLDLPLDCFDVLFAAKAEWDDGLASISPGTRSKLRQVLFRIMREAGVISEKNQIQSTYISARLRAMLRDKNSRELVLLPGLFREGGAA
jgi:hypothetical protein